MARLINSLAGRLGISVLLINAVLLPVLYIGLNAIVTRSEQNAHVTEMRTYARLVADQLELGGPRYADDQIHAILENVLISGDAVFAELKQAQRTVRAELGTRGSATRVVGDDFGFGAGGDDIYHLSIPLWQGAETGLLRFGFDERPVMNEIRRTRVLMLWALGAFFVVSTALAVYWGVLLARPLVELKRASRRVASGELDATLQASSRITEFRGLTADLEVMRAKLVSVGHRLQEEMKERDVAEQHRRRLEERLAERRRLETVGTLAAGIAHEFNNILVPIQLYTELAIEDVGEGPTRNDLVRVLESARRAKRIVTDILVFTREKASGTASGVGVAEIADEVVRLYEHMAPAGIEIVRRIPPGCPLVRGDAAMLHQIILNLCSNACQAMESRGGTLTVTVGPALDRTLALTDLEPGAYVDVCIRDTGHGIDQGVRARMFEPFFTTREVGQGTGLGLFVVLGMVTNMGGAVVVESEPDVATEFHVLLQVYVYEGADSHRADVKGEGK